MRTPVSTYRLQIRQGFTLFDAAETVPYLHSLGVDWVYLSPVLKAERDPTTAMTSRIRPWWTRSAAVPRAWPPFPRQPVLPAWAS